MNLRKYVILSLIGSAVVTSSMVSFAKEPQIAHEQTVIDTDDLYLTPEEINILRTKKHLLKRYINENRELEVLRNMMEEDSKSERYKDVLDSQNPYTEKQIKEMRLKYQSRMKAENSPLKPMVMQNRTVEVDLKGNQIIDVSIGKGYISSLVFYDQTGATWPISEDILGDGRSFRSHKSEKHPHIGIIEIQKEFVESNAIVQLEGLPLPIVFRLVGNQNEIDSRLSIRIPKNGPNANFKPFVTKPMINVSNDFLEVLNDDRLQGSKNFRLIGAPGDVFYKNGTLYIKTSAEIMSPPVDSWGKTPSGYNVYELKPTTELLMMVNGNMVDAQIKPETVVSIQENESIFTGE